MSHTTDWRELENFLKKLDDLEKKSGSERVRHSFDLSSLRDIVSQFDLVPPFTISIVGSKGKSSTAKILGQILQKLSVKAGLYTSPHLLYRTDRISIAERPSTPEQWAIWGGPLVRFVTEKSLYITRFEFETALALRAFQTEGVSVAVLEAGLGGVRDAIAAVPPNITVITGIELEHREILGGTIEEITRQKAGIFSPHSFAVIPSDLPQEAESVIRELASERRVQLIRSDIENFSEKYLDKFPKKDLQNFSIARTAAELFLCSLGDKEFELGQFISEKLDTLRAIFPDDVDIFNRMFIFLQNGQILPVSYPLLKFVGFLARSPKGNRISRGVKAMADWRYSSDFVIVDPAHTVVSVRVALERFLLVTGRTPSSVLIAPLADKELRGIIKIFTDVAEEIILVGLKHPRAPSLKRLNSIKDDFQRVKVASDLKSALLMSVGIGPCLAVGSNYLVKEILDLTE